ncbi:ankyrin [Aspergillus taichungensis]|uniref:Ankyrin n=1 Tax=Aspergillus taichungensis TaxID=482145 RepID=A0A2J5HTG6_9EURO|nr:ankyrin [Aspergillus taichungensis]
MSNSRAFSDLPPELLLEIAEYLRPRSFVAFMMALPSLASIMPKRLTAMEGRFGTVLGYMAMDRGSAEICRRLITRMEIDVNIKPDYWGSRALTTAMTRQHDVMVDLLLARPDIEINYRDQQRPLLHHVVNNRCIVSLRKLLARNNLDFNARSRWGDSALTRAAAAGCTEAMELLLREPGIVIEPDQRTWANKVDSYSREVGTLDTPLIHAAAQGHRDIVRLLLPLAHQTDATGTPLVDVNARCQYRGRTPLIRATLSRKVAVVEMLLEHILVDVNARDNKGRTALSHAAHMGHLPIIRRLLARPDVDVREPNSRRRTPLGHAAAKGFFTACQILLEHPDVECHARDSTGRTPLMHAAQSGSVETFRLLLYQCTNGEEDWTDRTGRGAWDYAHLKRHTEMMEIFSNYQIDQQAGSYDEDDAMDEGDGSNDSDGMDEGDESNDDDVMDERDD